jgi:hypothetical protein
MDLKNTLTNLGTLFLDNAYTELRTVIPFPEQEVANLLPELGWIETTDAHGNTVFVPAALEDNLTCHTWLSLSSDCEDETCLSFGHY